MAKDTKKAEDLELAPEKADEVKGGRLPNEPGGSTTRSLSVKKHKSGKKPVHHSGGKHY